MQDWDLHYYLKIDFSCYKPILSIFKNLPFLVFMSDDASVTWCFSEPETSTTLYHSLVSLCQWLKIKAEYCSLIQNKVIIGNSFLPVSLLIMSWELGLFISLFISSIVLLLLLWDRISEQIPKSAYYITNITYTIQYNTAPLIMQFKNLL